MVDLLSSVGGSFRYNCLYIEISSLSDECLSSLQKEMSSSDSFGEGVARVEREGDVVCVIVDCTKWDSVCWGNCSGFAHLPKDFMRALQLFVAENMIRIAYERVKDAV